MKTMESYEVCQCIIQGLLTGSPSGEYIYRNRSKQAGLISASTQTVRAMYSCNTWYLLFYGMPSRPQFACCDISKVIYQKFLQEAQKIKNIMLALSITCTFFCVYTIHMMVMNLTNLVCFYK